MHEPCPYDFVHVTLFSSAIPKYNVWSTTVLHAYYMIYIPLLLYTNIRVYSGVILHIDYCTHTVVPIAIYTCTQCHNGCCLT